MWNDSTAKYREAAAGARLLSVTTMLGAAFRPALIEPVTIGVQTGSVTEAAKAMGNTLRAYIYQKAPKTMSKLDSNIASATRLAEAIGLIGDFADTIMVNQRANLNDATSKYDKIAQKFFDVSQIAPLTSASKVAALKAGNSLLNKLADDILKKSSGLKSAKRLMSDLGIPENQLEQFSEWVKSDPFKNLNPDIALEDNPMSNMYRTAIRRFTEQTIQTPTPALKQRYATHPYGSFVYQLSSFVMAFETNVLKRNYRLFKEAATGKDYTAVDRIRLATPLILTGTLLTAMNAVSQELWDKILYNRDYQESKKAKEETPLSKGFSAILNAGLPGRYTSLINTFKYGNDLSKLALGPYLGKVASTGSNAYRTLTSKKKNQFQQRQMAKDLYQMFVLPSVNIGLSKAPIPPMASFAIMQLANSPQAKTFIADAAAGVPKKKKTKR
jgi:hypothetical protein